MNTPIKGWEPSDDTAATGNAVAGVAYQSLFSVIEDQLQGLPDDHPTAQKIRSKGLELKQLIDKFKDEQTNRLIEELETERGMIVLRIRRLHVEVTELNNRSKHLQATITQADSENINLQSYNVRKVENAKPSERMRLPGELEQWQAWLDEEKSKMQKLQDVLNAHEVEFMQVNAELNDKVQEFNLAQQREATLWQRIQHLKRSPEVLKERIKSQLVQLEERRELLKSALVSLGSFNTSGVGLQG